VRLFVRIVLIVSTAVGIAAHATIDAEARPAQELSQAEIEGQAKTEDAKMITFDVSPLFAKLADPKISAGVGMSPEESDLASRLQKIARVILKDCLQRIANTEKPPTRNATNERPSRKAERLRAEIVGHVEAILLEGILRPEHARVLRKATRRKTEPLLIGRDIDLDAEAPLKEESAAELVQLLRHYASTYPRQGTFWQVLLGDPGMRAAFPNGISHVAPALQVSARAGMPKVAIPNVQVDLAERLERLTVAIWQAWLTRDLDKVPLPTQMVLAQRLGAGSHRLRDSIFAHAEAIVLLGILTPDQSDECLRAVWTMMGLRALLDQGLASRLRTSVSQRDELLSLFQAKQKLTSDYMNSTSTIWDRRKDPEIQERLKQMADEMSTRQEDLDGMIWDSLSSSQARLLARALGIASQPTRRPKAKARKARSS
jgi:hypothetical protein